VFLNEKSEIFHSKTRSLLKKLLRPIFERSEKEGVNHLKMGMLFFINSLTCSRQICYALIFGKFG
jgi:hypothetical protein